MTPGFVWKPLFLRRPKDGLMVHVGAIQASHVRAFRFDACTLAEQAAWDATAPGPFHLSQFLLAAERHGPGSGRALALETSSGSRWGLVERSRLGLKAAVGWGAPVIMAASERTAEWDSLLTTLQKRGNAMVRLNAHASLRLQPEDTETIRSLCSRKGWDGTIGEFGTYVIDLSLPEETRWKALHEGNRRRVRGAMKEHLTLERLDPAQLPTYLAVSDATYERQGLQGPEHEYLSALIRDTRHFRFFAAMDADRTAHAVVVAACKDKQAVYLHGGSGGRSIQGAGNWLQWELGGHLAQERFERYDLGGVDLTSQDEKAVGIRRFKERMGGKLERHASAEISFSRIRRQVIDGTLAVARKARLTLTRR